MAYSRSRVIVKDLEELLEDKIIVGHSIYHDLDGLGINPDESLIRDTQTFPHFRAKVKKDIMSLNHLCKYYMQVNLDERRKDRGYHDAFEDASLTMQLYLKFEGKWEGMVRRGEYCYDREEAKNDVAVYLSQR
eukprot:Platyproteum_vivax@DN6737_c0_g1_i3.p1